MSPLHFTYSDEAAHLHGVKIGVHSRAGAGKTTLVATLAEMFPTILVSAESGLLSIRHHRIPTIVINSFPELEESYKYIAYDPSASGFYAVAVDSASEIAEKCLAAEKKVKKDPRAAYGEMHDKVLEVLKLFRDLPGRHVYFSFKQGMVKDDVTNISKYGPDMPGQQLNKDVPYLFDELFSLEVGTGADGKQFRYLRTKTHMQFEAKDRSGALDEIEYPHLGHVINKILAATSNGGK